MPAAPAPSAPALGLRQPGNLADAACHAGPDALAILSNGLVVPSRYALPCVLKSLDLCMELAHLVSRVPTDDHPPAALRKPHGSAKGMSRERTELAAAPRAATRRGSAAVARE